MSDTLGELNTHQLIYGIQMYPLEFVIFNGYYYRWVNYKVYVYAHQC